jgi:hypothetical protein
MKYTIQAVTLAVFAAAAVSSQAQAAHDCRVKPQLGVSVANLPDGKVRITALYLAVTDNASLTNTTCPDQYPPTWGSDTVVDEFGDQLGYKAIWYPGSLSEGVHAFSIAASQGYDVFQVLLYREFCVNISASGWATGVTCPEGYARTAIKYLRRKR